MSRLAHEVSIGVFALAIGYAAASVAADNLEVEVDRGIDSWTKTSGVVVTAPVQRQLRIDTVLARDQVLKNYAVQPAQLDEVTAKVVANYLDRSSANRQSASLASLFEQAVTGVGQVLPQLTDYPTLVIEVKPPLPEDFVVAIDQVAYPAGNRTFRVTEGFKKIRVGRPNKVPCDRQITVTRVGPNVIACAF